MLYLSHERFNSPEEGGITNIGKHLLESVELSVEKLSSTQRTELYSVSLNLPLSLCLCVSLPLSVFSISVLLLCLSLFLLLTLSHPGQAS